jgi:uncharacterized protein (DUF302 family)
VEYGYRKKLSISFKEGLEQTKTELTKEGFGILTEIDVKNTLKQKIGIEFDNYTILGACNPQLAYKSLLAEKEIGLLLPCNVIVYEDKGDVYVSAIVPSTAMDMVKNEQLGIIAKEVEGKLKKVIDTIDN